MQESVVPQTVRLATVAYVIMFACTKSPKGHKDHSMETQASWNNGNENITVGQAQPEWTVVEETKKVPMAPKQ